MSKGSSLLAMPNEIETAGLTWSVCSICSQTTDESVHRLKYVDVGRTSRFPTMHTLGLATIPC